MAYHPPLQRRLAASCLLLFFGSLGCGSSGEEQKTVELEQITTQPDSNLVNIPLLRRDQFIVWSFGASDDGGATVRNFSNGFSVTQIVELEAGASYAVRLESNQATTPLAVWDYKGNQFFPLPAGSDPAPVANWAALKNGSATSIFAVTDQSHNVWRLDADWTPMPLPNAMDKAALVTVAASRVIVWARSGDLYALDPNSAAFVPLGQNVLAVKSLHPLSDGSVAIVSIGQPDKLRILGVNNMLSEPRNLKLSGGNSSLEVCRDDMLAVAGEHSSDLGLTWTSPLDARFPLALASDTYTQQTRCFESRVLQILTPSGRNPVFLEIGADGSISTPQDAIPNLASGQPSELRVLLSGDLAVHYPIPQFFNGSTWELRDFPQLPLQGRDGQWHAYSFGGLEHFTSEDSITWQSVAPTHDGEPGLLTGSRPAQTFAGEGSEIWALTGHEMLLGLTGTLVIDSHWSRSTNGTAFIRVAEARYSADAETSIEIGKRLDVVGVSSHSEVATKTQLAPDGKTFQDFSFKDKAAGIFANGHILTQRITHTPNGNRIEFVIRDLAGIELTAWIPTFNGAEFRNELQVLGIDDQDRIWVRCTLSSPAICQTSAPNH